MPSPILPLFTSPNSHPKPLFLLHGFPFQPPLSSPPLLLAETHISLLKPFFLAPLDYPATSHWAADQLLPPLTLLFLFGTIPTPPYLPSLDQDTVVFVYCNRYCCFWISNWIKRKIFYYLLCCNWIFVFAATESKRSRIIGCNWF